MAELLKNMYNPAFFQGLVPVLAKHIPNFNEYDFIIRVFDNAWPDLELKGRIRQVISSLHYFVGNNDERARILSAIANDLMFQNSNSLPHTFFAGVLREVLNRPADLQLQSQDEFIVC
jgi:hypothetical protein